MYQLLPQELIINLVEKQLNTNKSRIAHVELSQYVKRLQIALKINMIFEMSVNHQNTFQ